MCEPIRTQSRLEKLCPSRSPGFHVRFTVIVWPGRTKLPLGPADAVFVSEPLVRPSNASSHTSLWGPCVPHVTDGADGVAGGAADATPSPVFVDAMTPAPRSTELRTLHPNRAWTLNRSHTECKHPVTIPRHLPTGPDTPPVRSPPPMRPGIYAMTRCPM